tara:strand:- start:189 stop:428 length:240 start_codon:yes stop_codon:yes gene_type:complete
VQINNEEPELLDTQGLYCPEPIMLLHSKIDDLKVGELCLLLASDPATKRDVPKFCQFLGHTLVSVEEVDQIFRYLIQKC